MNILFVETSHFTARVHDYLTDDEYRRLQWFLAEYPDSGAVIRGTGGLRKLRWSTGGRGKRGGVRVIYYWRTAKNRVYLLTLYGKNVKDDLTASEGRAWRRVLEEIENDST